jgi:2-phosphosulfolactate phosphatase
MPRIHLEWGLNGLLHTASAQAVAVVDVLSFSTCVDVACARGARVWPCVFKDAEAAALAQRIDALLASRRGQAGPSLSPASLNALDAGVRLVLPSPNGSTLSTRSLAPATYAACLRNAAAVGQRLMRSSGPIAVIAAGELWPDGSLRVALEDLLGAGAVVAAMQGDKSPEALAAEAAFALHRSRLHEALCATDSGRELIDRGFADDLLWASALNTSSACPRLVSGAYENEQP